MLAFKINWCYSIMMLRTLNIIRISHWGYVEINTPYSCSFIVFPISLHCNVRDGYTLWENLISFIVWWMQSGFNVFFSYFDYNANFFYCLNKRNNDPNDYKMTQMIIKWQSVITNPHLNCYFSLSNKFVK